jgi:hypothetical protein
VLGDGVARQQREHAGGALFLVRLALVRRRAWLCLLLTLSLGWAIRAIAAAVIGMVLRLCQCGGSNNEHERKERTA